MVSCPRLYKRNCRYHFHVTVKRYSGNLPLNNEFSRLDGNRFALSPAISQERATVATRWRKLWTGSIICGSKIGRCDGITCNWCGRSSRSIDRDGVSLVNGHPHCIVTVSEAVQQGLLDCNPALAVDWLPFTAACFSILFLVMFQAGGLMVRNGRGCVWGRLVVWVRE